jgi:hypothetical protein
MQNALMLFFQLNIYLLDWVYIKIDIDACVVSIGTFTYQLVYLQYQMGENLLSPHPRFRHPF